MGPEEKDWVDVANSLLLKCNLNLRLERITDCDANVFVALYEAVLGEKVPDYVAAERQEDDIHNVQSVIDSLALDCLQISLSHITGENIVRGDKESIRNLLEIFDGLLDYLTEQLSDEEKSQHEEFNGETHATPAALQDEDERQSLASSVHSAVQSSKHSLHSWNGDESEPTTELIRLGDSARTFTAKQEVLGAVETLDTDAVSTQASIIRESLQPAIPLQPPYQTTTVRPPPPPDSARDQAKQQPENSSQEIGHSSDGTPINGQLYSPVSKNSHVEIEWSESRQGRVQAEESEDKSKTGTGGPRRVLFRSQPDVMLLSLRDQLDDMEAGQNRHGELERENEQADQSLALHVVQRDRRHGAGKKNDKDGSLSLRSQRNKETEQELHDMSEKLSHRLEELDLMLKRALGEIGETSEPIEEDKQSHHSDSIMECRRTPKPQDSCDSSKDSRTRSLSPPPAPAYHSLQSRQENTLSKNLHRTKHRNTQEREYCQPVCRKAPLPRSSSKSSYSRSSWTKPQQQARRQTQPHRTESMRVKENNLLPILLEEFPLGQLSPHALSSMWKQQLRQIDHLNSYKNQSRNIQSKLSNQLEEAQKRHDMLVHIIRKEQEHNHRLREFRERIQQQKSAQNKLKEQRQQVARAKKYYSDYHVQLRSRLMSARTREERVLRQIFKEGLEMQKAHLREQRAYTKELNQEELRKHRDQIDAMEHYYRDQFSLLAETLAQERQDIQIHKKAQEKALQKMKRELRNRMEKEIGELQKIIIQNDEDVYFRDLEAERLRKRIQMASFQYNTNCLQRSQAE